MQSPNIDRTALRFRDLVIGQTFDFIDDARPGFNSFYSRCQKVSARMYASLDHPAYRYRVGTINVPVFHVGASAAWETR